MAALSVGTRVGPYEIVAPLGAGGMGEVYRAQDTRLDRTVAIKRLLPELAADADRRERFSQEARAVARLTHPHICSLYDITTEGEDLFLIMEYVQGETLESRIARTAGRGLPLEEALAMAADIAEALAFAHQHFIVHRDVKPANIMLTSTGAKLLDFGIARLREDPDGAADAATRTVLTREQSVMGTLPYMAPEQLDGRADSRSDIFAFGAVLFEALTGHRAFAGTTASSIIAAVVEHDPPGVTSLRKGIPPALDRVVRRCLAKKPEARWQSAADLADELRWIAQTGSRGESAAASAESTTRAGRGAVLRWSAVLGLAAAAGFMVWSAGWKPVPAPSPVTHLTITLPADVIPTGNLDISPDGSRIVFVVGTSEARRRQLYIRQLDAFDPLPLSGTDSAASPFFSPDGLSIAFFAGGKLKRVPAAGGAVTEICDASSGGWGAWGPDDMIVFSNPGARTGLFQVSALGGSPQVLTTPDPQEEGGHASPAFVGTAGAVLYVSVNTKAGVPRSVMVHSLKTGEHHKLTEGDFPVRFSASGHVVFRRVNTVFAIPIDPVTLRATGPEVPVLDAAVSGNVAISTVGHMVYRAARPTGGTLVWVDRNGGAQPMQIGNPGQRFETPRLSPNGERLVVTMGDGVRKDIGIYRFGNRTLTNMTNNGVSNSAYWTPNGQRIIYRVAGDLMSQMADDGKGPEALLSSNDPALRATASLAPGAFSPDGLQYLFVVHTSVANAADVWTMRTDRGRQIAPLVTRAANQWGVRVSPDGQWVSYSSDESGRFEIYIERFPDGGGRHPVSTSGGTQAVWSPARNELFYREGDRMMAVSLTGNPDSPTGVPRQLFEGEYESTPIPNYDVSRDGRRFVMVRPVVDDTQTRTIRVISNWFQELANRASAGRPK